MSKRRPPTTAEIDALVAYLDRTLHPLGQHGLHWNITTPTELTAVSAAWAGGPHLQSTALLTSVYRPVRLVDAVAAGITPQILDQIRRTALTVQLTMKTADVPHGDSPALVAARACQIAAQIGGVPPASLLRLVQTTGTVPHMHADSRYLRGLIRNLLRLITVLPADRAAQPVSIFDLQRLLTSCLDLRLGVDGAVAWVQAGFGFEQPNRIDLVDALMPWCPPAEWTGRKTLRLWRSRFVQFRADGFTPQEAHRYLPLVQDVSGPLPDRTTLEVMSALAGGVGGSGPGGFARLAA